MTKIIIAGGRDFYDYETFKKVLDKLLPDDRGSIEIVSGAAKGVDTLAKHYANENNITFKEFKANWEEDGKSAGYIRNAEMGRYADRLIAIWDGYSKGTKHMINFMCRANKKVTIVRYGGNHDIG